MARNLTVKARIVAEDDASGTIRDVRSEFKGLADFLGSRFTVTAGDVARAFNAIADSVKAGVDSAAEAEQAQRALEAALQRTGAVSQSFVAELNQQAEALENTTGATDTQITKVQSLMATLGVSRDRIKEATQAAVDLSAAFGIGLEAAARNVGRTVGGFAGELGELVPELRDLSNEALRAGDGITLLGAKFAGTAESQAQTLAVALQRLRTELAELPEEFVKGATGATSAAEGIQHLADTVEAAQTKFFNFGTGVAVLLEAMRQLKPEAEATGSALTAALIRTVENAALGIPNLIALLGQWAAENAKMAAATQALDQTTQALNQAYRENEELDQRLLFTTEQRTRALARAAEITERQKSAQDALNGALAEAGVTLRDFDEELRRQEVALELLNVAYRDGRISLEEYNFHVALVRANLAKIRAEMTGAAEDTDVFTLSLLGLTDAARGARLEVSGLGSSLQSVAASRTAMDGALGAFVIPGLVPSFDARTGARKFGVTNPFGVRFVPISTRPF